MASTLRRDFSFAFAGQVSTVIVGILRTFLIPLMLGANLHAYAQWQTYMLYVGYISIAYWGFNDGFYVRHPKRSDGPTRTRLSSAILVDTIFLVGQAAAFIILALTTDLFGDSRTIWIAVFANLPLTGLYGMLAYHLQLTGKIDKASVMITIEKLIFLLALLASYATGHLNIWTLVVIEIASKLTMAIYGCVLSRKTLLHGHFNWAIGFAEFKENISVGIKLMLGAYFALLLTGAVRMFVQVTASTTEFAHFAFAFSISNIVFQLGQVGTVVIYPHLSHIGKRDLGYYFAKIDRMLALIFPLLLLTYFPGAFLIETLFPLYHASATYLGLLLPAVGFQLMIGSLNGTYYRLLREERRMLFDNLFSLLTLSVLLLVLREHIVAMIQAQILVLALRVWLTQRRFRAQMSLPKSYAIFGQLVWSVAFLVAVQFQNPWLLAVFAVAVLVRTFSQRAEILAFYGRFLGGSGSETPER